jgi:hypothetical protein
MTQERERTIAERFADTRFIEARLQQAVREALVVHRKLGNPVCVWRNGQIVWIPPEEIPVQEDNPSWGKCQLIPNRK